MRSREGRPSLFSYLSPNTYLKVVVRATLKNCRDVSCLRHSVNETGTSGCKTSAAWQTEHLQEGSDHLFALGQWTRKGCRGKVWLELSRTSLCVTTPDEGRQLESSLVSHVFNSCFVFCSLDCEELCSSHFFFCIPQHGEGLGKAIKDEYKWLKNIILLIFNLVKGLNLTHIWA